MGERYTFAVPDGSVIWNQELDASLGDHYVSAIEDNTQYLSILDSTTEVALDVNLSNAKIEVESDDFITGENDDNEDQVVVFTVDGSDELYGIQVGQDDEGNLRKFQFQFRKGADGSLEAMPETIQLLPLDEVEGDEQIVDETPAMQIFVGEDNSEEHILPNNVDFPIPVEPEEESIQYEDSAIQMDEEEEEEDDNEDFEAKPNTILESVKQEIQDVQIEFHPDDSVPENEDNSSTPAIHEEYTDEDTETSTNEHIEHVEVNPDMEIMHEPDISDAEDYQIIEGLHVTDELAGATNLNEIVDKNCNTTILRQALRNNIPKTKKDNSLYFYVLQQTEKENVDSLSMGMENLGKPKVNPRSILKSSYGMFQSQNENQQNPKRFAKSKEAVQARIFNNFINKTTIPQAPIRKDRLPRKQQIKPVNRQDEEIVVQEVMVSSSGFVEKIDTENVSVLDYVELSDSDDDYDSKKLTIKKTKCRKKRIISISDTDDNDSESIIDLVETDDENDTPSEPRKKRGRPPKPKPTIEPPTSKKTQPSEPIEPTTKPEIPCPQCEKTFPSQNSLKTHLQHHNLQTTLSKARPTLFNKYKCEMCGQIFKHQILENRHICPNKCTTCQKKFHSQTELKEHRKSHIKKTLSRLTIESHVSPKKFKLVNKIRREERYKCRICSKICSDALILNTHLKSHKIFDCHRCANSFLSNFLLEKHLREKCVKTPSRIIDRPSRITGIPVNENLAKVLRRMKE